MKRHTDFLYFYFILFCNCNTATFADSVDSGLIGSSIYSTLVTDLSYAYLVKSDVNIGYNVTSANYTIANDRINLIHSVDVPWNTAKDSNLFVCPVSSFSIVIGANVPVIGNGTLILTPPLICDMATNSSKRWNDPEIVALNPALATVSVPIRFYLDKNPTSFNQFLIDYFCGNTSVTNGDWTSISSSRNVLVNGFSSIVSALSLSSNSLGFLPYPIVKSYQGATSISFVALQKDNSTILKHSDNITFSMQRDGSVLSAESSTSDWPLNMFTYVVYNQTTVHCSVATENLRFFYWVANNDRTKNRTIGIGFNYFDSGSYNTTKVHMMTAKCQGPTGLENTLYYTNLSDTKRSNFMFAVSCIFSALFIGIVIAGWVISENKRKYKAGNIISRSFVVFGLLLSFVSFVAWWYPPSSDAICKIRIWFLNLGFTNVVVAVFVYSVAISVMYSKSARHDMFTTKHFVITCFGFNIAEIAILLIWHLGEGIKSQEVDVDPILWTRVYTCSSSSGYAELLQLCWFCFVALFGCFVIFRRWKEREYSQEDTRWLLMALYCQILLFVVLMILTRINSWDDDTLYPAYVSFFLIAISMVIFAFFLPGLLKRLEYIVKSIDSDSSTIGSNRVDSPDSNKEYRLKRGESARKMSIEMDNSATKTGIIEPTV